MMARSLIACIGGSLFVVACTTTAPTPPTNPAVVGDWRPGYAKGYLPEAELPNSLDLLAPPPSEGSAAMAADVEAFRQLTAFLGDSRGAMAAKDADLKLPKAAEIFSCSLGVRISEQTTPHLNMLLRRTLSDAAQATQKAKQAYQRTRPYVLLNTSTCVPSDESRLAKDGSYPSGHSAIGWTWALVLAELAPERADALLRRGRAYGQSRGICGYHWKSDIEAGRLIGAATVARLHDDEMFKAQIVAARGEISKATAQGQVPAAAACAAEAATLASANRLAP